MTEVPRTANPSQAKLLLDPHLSPLLEALAKAGPGGLGAADLARQTATPLSTVHARLARLLAAGVLELAGTRARAGCPVRLYCLPLPWQIPFEVTPAATLRDLLGGGFGERLRGHLDRLAGRMLNLGETWSIHLQCAEDGELMHTFQHAESQGRSLPPEPLLAEGHELRLNTARAQELQRRLWALLQEYAVTQDTGEVPNWSVTVLLTPEVR
jgi:hypothetical protein